MCERSSRLPFNSGSDSHQLLVPDEIKPRTWNQLVRSTVSKIGGRIKGGLFTSNLSLQPRRSLPSEARPMGDPLPASRRRWLFAVGTNWAVLPVFSSVNSTLTNFVLFRGSNLNCGSVNRSEIKFPFVWCVICHRFTVAIVRTRTKQVGMKRGVPGHGT